MSIFEYNEELHLKNKRNLARNEGIAEGEQKKLVELVCRKLRRGKTAEVISEDLEEEFSVITRICKAAEEFAPDYDRELVYRKLFGKTDK